MHCFRVKLKDKYGECKAGERTIGCCESEYLLERSGRASEEVTEWKWGTRYMERVLLGESSLGMSWTNGGGEEEIVQAGLLRPG